jgi:phosphoenolpyruvate carboxykinase (GTP)
MRSANGFDREPKTISCWDFTYENFHQLMEVDCRAWIREALSDEELALKLYGKLPKEFLLDRDLLVSRLWRSPETWKLAPELPY